MQITQNNQHFMRSKIVCERVRFFVLACLKWLYLQSGPYPSLSVSGGHFFVCFRCFRDFNSCGLRGYRVVQLLETCILP